MMGIALVQWGVRGLRQRRNPGCMTGIPRRQSGELLYYVWARFDGSFFPLMMGNSAV